MNLAGKVALVTGGRRVGGALASLLAQRGAAVGLTYHTSRRPIEETVSPRSNPRGAAPWPLPPTWAAPIRPSGPWPRSSRHSAGSTCS